MRYLSEKRMIKTPDSKLLADDLKEIFTRNQETSRLLFKLPRELKNYIWELACGGNVIHINGIGESNSRISHVENTLCHEPDVYDKIFEAGDAVADPAHYWHRKNDKPHEACKSRDGQNKHRYTIGILTTCRQTYFECRPFHFGCNTFLIDNYGTLECFYRRVHCNYHHLIRNMILRIDVCNPKYWKSWERIIGKDLALYRRGIGMEHLQIIILHDHYQADPIYHPPSKAWLPNLSGLGRPNKLGKTIFPNLKTCQVMMTDHKFMGFPSPSSRMRGAPDGIDGTTAIWTNAQKLEWANYFRLSILGKIPAHNGDTTEVEDN
ncbi:MAG: hypothetical protein LQ350_004604 [Teloschistes chrysophthalmus]|nr:MAG: hypothetical protein LQ350_004604 [Niorma chrysophthalma]